MLCCDKNPYNLRNRSNPKKRKPFFPITPPEKKKLRNYDHITYLPDEILLQIFSYLTIEDLYFNVRCVCKKWQRLAMLTSPWSKVCVSYEIPTNILVNWIQFSPVIKVLTICDRNDADVVLKNVAKYSLNLQSLVVENCWGSTGKVYLGSKPLCRLLLRCKKLEKIQFDRVKIRSCKFFKLLAKRKSNNKFLPLSYVGPATPKQFLTLREACSGWIFTEYI